MLNSLKIKNLAIIDELEIDFESGFNVITGETGSGKTIFLKGILLLLAKKSTPSEFIRHGENFCTVEAVFNIDNEEIVVRKEFFLSGRTKAYIDGNFSSQSKLTDILSRYIEFSAQNENQMLFNNKLQLELLDSFGSLTYLTKEYSDTFKKYVSVKARINSMENEKTKINDLKNIYEYHLELINNLQLENPDEESILAKEIEYAENIEKIKENINFCYYEISGGENSIAKRINLIKEKLGEIAEFKPELNEILSVVNEIEINIDEVGKSALREISGITEEHGNITLLYERLNRIKTLKKRLNKSSVEEILKYRDEIEEKLNNFENFSFDIEELKNTEKKLKETLEKQADKLSQERRKAKVQFEKEVALHLNDLKMNNITFKINFIKLEGLTEHGKDEISFMISTNKGEPLKPLSKIASGGELSRIMLALKTVLSEHLNVPILIFDEIDSGTGGETSFAIGKKIREISLKHQVLVITHLAQVAAFADNHYKIFKENKNGRILSNIKKLTLKERTEEIARMLSGEKITEKSLENARELLEITKDA
jgi:DNA repair protein RecN (Recombination protein N)